MVSIVYAWSFSICSRLLPHCTLRCDLIEKWVYIGRMKVWAKKHLLALRSTFSSTGTCVSAIESVIWENAYSEGVALKQMCRKRRRFSSFIVCVQFSVALASWDHVHLYIGLAWAFLAAHSVMIENNSRSSRARVADLVGLFGWFRSWF